jgi:hypothetical protein
MAFLPCHKGLWTLLYFLTLAALLCIPLAWDSLESLRPAIITPPTQSLAVPLTNNNITYPRKAARTLSLEKAREYIARLDALRGIAFSPHYKFMQVHNLQNVDRLLEYLARVVAGERLPIPRVVLSSYQFHPACYDERNSNGEVEWMRPVVSIPCLHSSYSF